MGKALIIKGADFSAYSVGKINVASTPSGGGGTTGGGTTGGGTTGGGTQGGGGVYYYNGYSYPSVTYNSAAGVLLGRHIFVCTPYSSSASNVYNYVIPTTSSADNQSTFALFPLSENRTITIPNGYQYVITLFTDASDGYSATGKCARSSSITSSGVTIQSSDLRSIVAQNMDTYDHEGSLDEVYDSSHTYRYWTIYVTPNPNAGVTPSQAIAAGFKVE